MGKNTHFYFYKFEKIKYNSLKTKGFFINFNSNIGILIATNLLKFVI